MLALRGIRKRFSGAIALDNVGFDLQQGEIHALLGENGAGKSTLIKILGGIHLPDAGTIEINGKTAKIQNVADAESHSIRIIHQELSLAPNMSIAENIYLGHEPRGLGLLNRSRMFNDAEVLVRDLGLDEIRSVRTVVSTLSVAHQQLVEIARALSCNARILVLDEPTSSLSEAETDALFATLDRLRSQGVGIIYISHRLEETIRLADRITVLRDGHSIGTQAADGISRQELIRWMVGRDITDHFHRPAHQPGGPALEVRGLRNENVHNVSFALHHGEILGIAGLVGSGRTELGRALFGIDRLESGEIFIDGEPINIRSPRDALDAGVVLVPEDRKIEGLVATHSTAFNIALPWVRDWIRFCIPSRRTRDAIVERTVRNFTIKVAHPDLPINSLSGGNQQKVLIGRWMEHRPRILVLDEPTRGIDVGAREEIFRIISSLVESGMAVVLISSDLAEVVNMSHRVAVYRDGRILRTAPAENVTLEEIMELLTGTQTA